MTNFSRITGFDWDEGNSDKNYQKHGVTTKEAEEVFIDEKLMIYDDEKHSVQELRSNAIGKTLQGKLLFIAFTIRENYIRIISIRIADKKERRLYEET